MRLEEHEYGVITVTDRAMPVLTTDQVCDTLEHVRR
jgi:hypothetical protein